MTGGAPAPPHGPPAPAALGALIALLEARCGLLSQPIERAAIDAAAQAALREAGAVPAAPPPALRGGNAAAAAGASTGTPSCGVSSCSTAATPPRAGAAASQDPAGCPDAAAAPPLLRMLQHHGWAGRSFAGPLDARRLASRLKAFLYEGLRPCGSGSYSVVYHARCKLTGAPVVLKRVRLEGGAEGLPSTALREASLLRQLAASPHVVQ